MLLQSRTSNIKEWVCIKERVKRMKCIVARNEHEQGGMTASGN